MLTTAGILFNSEISEDQEWFSMFQTGLELPDIATEPTNEPVENWDMEESIRQQLTDQLSDLLYNID